MHTDEDNELLAKAFLKVLEPLVRIAIKHRISHAEFTEMARQAYVDQSYKHFGLPNRKTTVSRVAVLTGLSRKEVVRLTSEGESSSPQPKIAPNRAARVMMGWITDPQFCNQNNEPKELAMKEGNSSFTALVERYSGDVPPVAVLDELMLSGIVSKLDGDKVRLNNSGYVPQTDELKKFEILSACTKDLLNTGIHNMENPKKEDALFQRQFKSRLLPESLAQEFKAFSHQKSEALLVEFSQWLRAKAEQQIHQPDEPKKHVGIGIYFTEEPEDGKD